MRLQVIAILLLVAGATLLRAQAPIPEQGSEQKILLELRAQGIGGIEINTILRDKIVFVPAIETFRFLGIKTDVDSLTGRLSGIFRSSENSWTIDPVDKEAVLAGRKTTLGDTDYIMRSDTMYVSLVFTNHFYGLNLVYLPRRLQVVARDAYDLPAVATARKLKLYQRRSFFQEFPAPDLILDRDIRILNGGHIDWTSTARFSKQKYTGSDHNFYFGVKSLGADFTGRLFSSLQPGRHTNTLRARMRYPFIDNAWIQQIVGGDFLGTGVVTQDVTGFEMTNRPAATRRMFARELFQGAVAPDMNVALSGGLGDVRLQQADELGQYQFDVPILYGNGLVEVHAFDMWGQERTFRYRMVVPQSLIPPGQFEYDLAGGWLRQPKDVGTFSGSARWGTSSNLTLGTIVAYYDYTKRTPTKTYAGITGTARVLDNLIFDAKVIPQGLSQMSADLQFPSTARMTLTNTHYGESPLFNPTGVINDLTAQLSLPIFGNRQSYVLSLLGSQSVYDAYRYDEIQGSLSAVFTNFSPSYSTRAQWIRQYPQGRSLLFHQSDLAVSFMMPAGVNVRGELTYDHLASTVQSIQGTLLKDLTTGLKLLFAYSKIVPANFYNIGVRLIYYFPFTKFTAGASTSGGNQYEYSASSTGSLDFDLVNPSVVFNNTPSNVVNNAGFYVRPFFDANGNGVQDGDEQPIEIGRIFYENTTVGNQFYSLPITKVNRRGIYNYERYNIYLDQQSLDDPTWVPTTRGVQVLSEPNFVRRINIPVVNGGIIRGKVTIQTTTTIPAENIKVLLVAKTEGNERKPKYTKQLSTFSTGEFEVVGVPPGSYTLQLDAQQLSTLRYSVSPTSIDLTIQIKEAGDISEGNNFVLKPM